MQLILLKKTVEFIISL